MCTFRSIVPQGSPLVLHTWKRDLLFHPHLHAIITGGGLSFDGSKWIDLPDDNFLFYLPNLSKVFRGKFLDGFISLWEAGKIDLTEPQSRKLVRESKKHHWVLYAKQPLCGDCDYVELPRESAERDPFPLPLLRIIV
jgi:hypothetical protein